MKKKLHMLLFLLFLGVFCVSAWKLIGIYRTYEKGDSIYGKITDMVVKTETDTYQPQITDDPKDVEEKEKTKKDKMISVDFKTLKAKNEDIIGWLYIPDSAISYPLLQSEDNSKYLHETYDKQSSIFGSIFMDYRNHSDFTDKHTIIYGHNMKNGSMFGTLKRYSDTNFFKEHRNIYILTEKGTFRYRVFSYHVADASGRVYTTSFSDNNAYKEFLNLITGSSYVKTKLKATAKDRTITLSTCTGQEESRFVVHAKYMGKMVEKDK